MEKKRILLMYISEDSGHHCASMAIENAVRRLSPGYETLSINAFNYTNPILEKVINKAYMGVVKRRPEIWDYLYDNPKVLERTRRLRQIIHNINSPKLKILFDEFRPEAVICTQAFPCGMVADYKKTYGLGLPLAGVLTDYAPHSYWIYNNVDYYIVPSEETGRSLVASGVSADRVKALGIPIDPRFKDDTDRAKVARELALDMDVPTVLIMGGTQGLGPIRELVGLLDNVPHPLQLIVVTGTNRRLFRWLKGRHKRFRQRSVIYGFTRNIDELMGFASVIVTKAGGITTAEALAKGLPMIILSPLPGQEAMNTKYLLREGVALKAENTHDCALLLEELLYYNVDKLRSMSMNARRCSKPESSIEIARLIVGAIR